MDIDFSQWKLVPRKLSAEQYEAARDAAPGVANVYAVAVACSPSPPVDVAGLVLECARLREVMREYAEAQAAYDAQAAIHGDESNHRDMRPVRARMIAAAKAYRAALTHQDPTK